MIVVGLIYIIFMVAAFAVFAAGLDFGNKSVTRAGLVLVVIWGAWAVMH